MTKLEDPAAERARNRRYWAKHKDKRNAYLRAYRRRKMAEDPAYREKTLARARRAAKTRRERVTQMILAAKDGPCVDCGIRLPPQIMDLDHCRGEKRFTLGHAARGVYRTYGEINEEIAKCDLRCPNCHRLRHFDEGYIDEDGHRRSRRVRGSGAAGPRADTQVPSS